MGPSGSALVQMRGGCGEWKGGSKGRDTKETDHTGLALPECGASESRPLVSRLRSGEDGGTRADEEGREEVTLERCLARFCICWI